MRFRILPLALLTLIGCGEQPFDPEARQAISPDQAIAKGYELKGRILFAVRDLTNGETSIHSMNADGTGEVNLTPGPWGGIQPDWSSRTRLIAFSDDRFGSFDIFVMREDGTGVTRLTSDPAHENYPAWSPDGRQIAFENSADGDNEIYVMNADGTGAVQLTQNGSSDTEPFWSPDGRIAFRAAGGVMVMNPDGSNLQSLVPNTSLFEGQWSPRGDRIAFSCGSLCGLEVHDLSGGAPLSLDPTPVTALERSPTWSPDARQIAFTAHTFINTCDIFRMNADGTSVTQLTFTGIGPVALVCNFDPDWYR
jgi:Tol biopolymer transport system component